MIYCRSFYLFISKFDMHKMNFYPLQMSGPNEAIIGDNLHLAQTKDEQHSPK
jgi:hypothetical protein